MALIKDRSVSLNRGFSKFIEKKYPTVCNVRVIVTSEKFVFTRKKSEYSNKSLFLRKSIKIEYLYDFENVPSDWGWSDGFNCNGTAYVTPKEFTYITLMS